MRASRDIENLNRLGGMAGKSQRKTVVGGLDETLGGLEERNRLVVLALSDLDERALQDDLRLGGSQRQSVAVSGFCRSEAAGTEIGIAEKTADRRVLRAGFNRALREIDGRSIIACTKRHLCTKTVGEIGLALR